MSTIAAKTAALRDLGTHAAMAPVVFGTGGSTRRARRAVKLGLAEFFAEAYALALEETGSHPEAVAMCDALWDAEVGQPYAEARSEVTEGDEAGDDAEGDEPEVSEEVLARRLARREKAAAGFLRRKGLTVAPATVAAIVESSRTKREVYTRLEAAAKAKPAAKPSAAPIVVAAPVKPAKPARKARKSAPVGEALTLAVDPASGAPLVRTAKVPAAVVRADAMATVAAQLGR